MIKKICYLKYSVQNITLKFKREKAVAHKIGEVKEIVSKILQNV